MKTTPIRAFVTLEAQVDDRYFRVCAFRGDITPLGIEPGAETYLDINTADYPDEDEDWRTFDPEYHGEGDEAAIICSIINAHRMGVK